MESKERRKIEEKERSDLCFMFFLSFLFLFFLLGKHNYDDWEERKKMVLTGILGLE